MKDRRASPGQSLYKDLSFISMSSGGYTTMTRDEEFRYGKNQSLTGSELHVPSDATLQPPNPAPTHQRSHLRNPIPIHTDGQPRLPENSPHTDLEHARPLPTVPFDQAVPNDFYEARRISGLTLSDDGSPDLRGPVASSWSNAKPEQPQRFHQRHRKKLICGCLLLLILILIIVIVIFALLPKIAQGYVDSSQLQFSSLEVREPTSKGFKSRVTGSITNAGPMDAHVDEMHLSVLSGDHEIGKMVMPAMDLKGGAANFDVESDFQITNATAFKSFQPNMINKSSFQWRIVGDSKVKSMGTTLEGIKFDKTVDIKGMDSSKTKIELLAFKMYGSMKSIENEITAKMINPSQIGIDIGNAIFEMIYSNVTIGRAEAKNFTLKAGENRITMKGKLLRAKDARAEEAFSDLFTKFVNKQDVKVTCVGVKATRPNSNEEIEWLNNALKNMRMSVSLPPMQDQQLVQSLSMKGFKNDFNTDDPMIPQVSADQIRVQVKMPVDFPLETKQIRMGFNLMAEDGTIMTKVQSDSFVQAEMPDEETIVTAMEPMDMVIQKGKGKEKFIEMMNDLMNSKVKEVGVTGTTDMVAECAIGTVTLKNIKFKSSTELKGMQGLKVPPKGRTTNPTIIKTDVIRTTNESLISTATTVMYSPSDMSLQLGNVTLDIMYENTKIGVTTIPNMKLVPGLETKTLESRLSPFLAKDSKRKLEKLLSNMASGMNSKVELRGAKASSRHPVLSELLSQLKMVTVFPAAPPMTVQSYLRMNPISALFTQKALNALVLKNPFSVTMKLTSLSATIYYNGIELGEVAQRFDGRSSIIIPPQSSITTNYFDIKMKNLMSMESLSAALKGFQGSLKVDAVGKLRVLLGTLDFSLDFQQKGIPTKMSIQ